MLSGYKTITIQLITNQENQKKQRKTDEKGLENLVNEDIHIE